MFKSIQLTVDEISRLGGLIQRLRDNEQLGKFGLSYDGAGVRLDRETGSYLISQLEIEALAQILARNELPARPIRPHNGGP